MQTKYTVHKYLSNTNLRKYKDGTLKRFINVNDFLPDEYTEEEINDLLNKKWITKEVVRDDKVKVCELAEEIGFKAKELATIGEKILDKKLHHLTWITLDEANLIKENLSNDTNR